MSHLIQYTISKSIRQGKNKNDKIFCIYSELLSQTGRGTLNVVNTSKKEKKIHKIKNYQNIFLIYLLQTSIL